MSGIDTQKQVALSVKNLGKHYTVFSSPSDILAEAITGRKRHRAVEALNDVSFDIYRGEMVGIVGRNGAGKSTILKMIAGTLKPSTGSVDVRGRVTAILELGTGFNPQRSARENVAISGLCLGMSRKEVAEKFDEIVDFAEVRDFIDQPLKTFSTGMAARLAFAVATAVDPEILIVDEALSVGDAKFQKKCFARFEEFSAAGKTILFVTHYAQLIEMICDRGIYLEKGRLIADGAPKQVIGRYLADLFGPSERAVAQRESSSPSEQRYGVGGVRITDVDLLDSEGRPVRMLASGAPARIKVRVLKESAEPINGLNIGVNIRTKHGVHLMGINPPLTRQQLPVLEEGEELEVYVDFTANLGTGDFFLTIGAWSLESEHHYDRRVDVLHFVITGDFSLSQSLVNLGQTYSFAKFDSPT